MNNRRNRKKDPSEIQGLTVTVQNGNFEKAMRQFKKKCNEAGIVKEVRDRQHYIKPTTKRKMAKAAARKRWEKYVKSQEL